MAMALVAIGVTLAAVLLQKDQRRSGTDLTPNGAHVAGLHAHQQTCQGEELLPADTSALRVTIGTYDKPGPPIELTVTGPHGEDLTSGRLGAGWRQGLVQIPVRHVSDATQGAQICLHDEGPGPITVAGAVPDPGFHMQVGNSTIEGRLRYDFMRPGRESWLSLLPTIVHRSTFAKAGLIRHWAWAAAALLMLLAIGLASLTVVREGSA